MNMKWSMYNELIEDVSNKDIIYLFKFRKLIDNLLLGI